MENSNDMEIDMSPPKTNLPNAELDVRRAFFENYNSDDPSTCEKKIKSIKKRFSGPAGLLPQIPLKKEIEDESKLTSKNISSINDSELERSNLKSNQQQLIQVEKFLTDRHILNMNKGPWRELIHSLQLDPENPDSLIKLSNIRWVVQSMWSEPPTTKIPFLAFVIFEKGGQFISRKLNQFQCSYTIMDFTGKLSLSFSSTLMQKIGHDLTPGTAVAIKNACVLRLKQRKLHVTVSESNLILIAKIKDIGGLDEDVKKEVELTHFSHLNQLEAKSDYYLIQNKLISSRLQSGAGTEM